MENKMGIDELKQAVKLILDMIQVGVGVAKDGKVDVSDLGLLMTLIPDFGPAFSGAGTIPAELADMTTEEAEELVAFVMAGLVVPNDHARILVEKSLKVAAATFELIKAIKA